MEYTKDFIQAINDWQLGGKDLEEKRKLAERLCELNIPTELKRCDVYCYRSTLFAPKGKGLSLMTAGVSETIDMEISSWTTDYEIAKNFKPIPDPTNKEFRFIVKVMPRPEDIIINLNTLYADNVFREACIKYKKEISGYSSGIGCYNDVEKEVVLNSIVNTDDIFAWGSHHSSDIETLAKIYYKIFYNKSEQDITQSDIDFFYSLFKQSNETTGVRWLDEPNSVKRITDKLKTTSKYFKSLNEKYPDTFKL